MMQQTARCCAGATAGFSGRVVAPLSLSRRSPLLAARPLQLQDACSVQALASLRKRPQQQQQRQHRLSCQAESGPDGGGSSPPPPPSSGGNAVGELLGRFNAAYLAIFAVYGGLLFLHNPYIFAALTIITIIPQNSSNASLNSLVLIFYESGLFMNFAEAVYCVRLVTWLSIVCTLISFAIYT